jgi:hypothetical protein
MAVANKLSDFVEGVQAGGRLFFSAQEIPQAEGSRAVEAALRRLAAKGAIRRLMTKSPAFVIVPPEHRSMGLPPVDWWLDDLMRHLRQDYYLGLLSAAATIGSSHFAVLETQVVTTKWLRPIETARLRIRFFQKSHIPGDAVEERQTPWGPLKISTPALTALDLVAYPACSPAQALLILADLRARVGRQDLLKVIAEWDDTPTAQRLGFLLEKAGATKLAEGVHGWIVQRRSSVVDLEPGPDVGPVDTRWNVRVNTALEATA